MLKFYFASLVTATILFTGCTSNNYNLHKDLVDFENNKTNTFDRCSGFTYKNILETNNYGKLYIESLDLGMNCRWNGFERGFFTTLFKNELKLNSMKKVEELNYSNYEITTYKINDDSYVNFIYYFLANSSEIIIDYDGILSQEIASKFDGNYKSKYLDKKRFDSDFNSSLVEKNFIGNYFQEEYEVLEKN